MTFCNSKLCDMWLTKLAPCKPLQANEATGRDIG